ncbi:hypothetical protein KML24007_03970 [Alistipes indistinctus]|uniref:hypothetical protein n=1 Tax=Alistipes indistinctus TaxID=626932 RepID=UPI0036F3BEC2
MKREDAIKTALNFMAQQSDYEFSGVSMKSMEGNSAGKITVQMKTEDRETGDPLTIEVAIDPHYDEISWKIVRKEARLSDYLQPATPLGKLKVGQKFRLKYDCVVYEYFGDSNDIHSGCPHIIKRADTGYVSRVNGQDVFPIGK